jgi:hypothetical protein
MATATTALGLHLLQDPLTIHPNPAPVPQPLELKVLAIWLPPWRRIKLLQKAQKPVKLDSTICCSTTLGCWYLRQNNICTPRHVKGETGLPEAGREVVYITAKVRAGEERLSTDEVGRSSRMLSWSSRGSNERTLMLGLGCWRAGILACTSLTLQVKE